jgi:hypothetical protein
MKKKEFFKLLGGLFLMLVAVLIGSTTGVCYAATTGGGQSANINPGVTIVDNEGGATATEGHKQTEDNNPEFYAKEIDKRITKMRPMRTPIDQITRKAESISKSSSMIVKYYSVSTRPIRSTVSTAVTAMVSGASNTAIEVDDSALFSVTDTIRVVGVKGFLEDGQTQDTVKDLVLYVIGKNNNTGYPLVIAVNGRRNTTGANSLVPAIPADTVLIRMGRAAGELDVETGNFYNLPEPEEQFCQRFMMQVEQSTFDKIWAKEVDWNFNDMEEDAIYDMRLGMENSFMFGVKSKGKDPYKNTDVYFTGGIWWMAGQDKGIGTLDNTTNEFNITDDEMVDFLKEVFTGNDAGNKVKLAFCGSDYLATLAKMKSERFKVVKEVEKWGLKFTSFDSNFGQLLAMHHELMDMNGMADSAFILDPEYLSKKTFEMFSRKTYDMEALAKRKTNAVVMNEASCVYLRYPKAHLRSKLGA